MAKIFIGIDPGTKTGIAVWDCDRKQFELIKTCGIIAAMRAVELLIKASDFEVKSILIEDARKRKWFGKNALEKAQGAGSVKRDCSIWEEFCISLNAPFLFKAPSAGTTKLSSAHFAKLSGYTGKTSIHARDAAMLVIGRG